MSRFVIIVILCSCFADLVGQSINTEFGKNRVQYHDDFNNWWEYETENFVTYWYGKGRFIAQPTIQIAEMDHDAIQKIIEHRINDKIEIIVYTDITDLKQSNIGTEETFSNKTGETKIVGNKMFVYFDGNHLHLRKKIREGIATVYLNNMLFGSTLQEIIQNAVLLNIPDWYKEGIVAFAANDWNHLVEDEMRDIWERDKKYHEFDKMATDFPKLAGHSFWFYVSQNYGKSAISNLLYLTKISRGMENSFEYILNADLPTLKQEWENYYKQYFDSEKGKMEALSKSKLLKLANKKYTPISQVKLSPDGKNLLYSYNDQGKIRVVLRDLKSNKEQTIFKYGYKNAFQETDYNYPLLAWHPDKKEISIVYEHRDIIQLIKYHVPSGEKMEQIIPTDFQRVYSICYINDLDYIMSASTDGYSDLYHYQSKNRNYQRLTNDFYDDLDAEYVTLNGQKGILFSSNRTTDTIRDIKFDTILPLEKFDIYFLPEGAKTAQQLTFTEYANERFPYIINEKSIICTADGTGINNTFILNLDTKNLIAITNLDRNLIRHHAMSGSDNYVYTLYNDGKYQVYKEQIPITPIQPYVTQTGRALQPINKNILIVPPTKAQNSVEKIEDGFLFQSHYPDPAQLETIKTKPESQNGNEEFSINIKDQIKTNHRIEPYVNTRAIAANNKFALTNITTKLDNSLLFEGLESYTGDRQQLLTTPIGFLLKAKVQDLFEDYDVEAGLRIPTTFNGSEYFIVFNNKKSRIDKKFALYRKSNEYNVDTDPNSNLILRSKKTSVLGLFQWKYPFDIYRSFRATTTLRFDKFLQLSTENQSFLAPAVNEKRISLKLEYVYDNTHDAALNIKHGTRYKIYTEVINRFNIQLIDGFQFSASDGLTGIVGFDARHYIPILGKALLAIRGAGATSFGSEKMLYYMGGMENWLFPKFNNSIPIPDHSDYAYKANVFQLRGFDNNIRNGATFLISNTELRIPFMQYILGKNRGNAFFRNLQLTGFFDAGLAWHGSGPFSAKNPLNSTTISSPPLIEVEIEYFRDPLVMGLGYGLRTQLLGYFVKLDYGWGIETRKVQSPKLYLSFGLDF
ncbi:MAG: WD40 repeat domain-containing protein [Saprospiraceae bacterium]